MNLYLLRVGADSTFYSHKFSDRSYIFIPIPDDERNLIIERAITYQDYTWNKQPVPDYLLQRIARQYVHNDPEFKTFTYGSPKCNQDGSGEKNYKTLAKIMKKGDMLTFYAAFTSNGRDIEGYYFFAYFIVDRTIKYCNPDELKEEDRDRVRGNHHFIHRLPNQVIVNGDFRSRVLKRAVLLSSRNDREGSNYRPCQLVRNLLGGYKKSMNRSSIRNIPIDESKITQFRKHLDENGGRIQDP